MRIRIITNYNFEIIEMGVVDFVVTSVFVPLMLVAAFLTVISLQC